MTRAELEHIIRAAAAIANVEDVVVVGSQAVLGQFPDAPAAFRISREADVFPLADSTRSDLIDGAIGEGSPFEQTFGYYAHGVDETTSTLPPGWRERLVLVQNENTRGSRGWCLEIHDLAVAKLVEERGIDLEFVALALRHGMADAATVAGRLRATDLDGAHRSLAMQRLAACAAPPPPPH